MWHLVWRMNLNYFKKKPFNHLLNLKMSKSWQIQSFDILQKSFGSQNGNEGKECRKNYF